MKYINDFTHILPHCYWCHIATMVSIASLIPNAIFIVRVRGPDGQWQIAMQGEREYPTLPRVERANVRHILQGVEPVHVGRYTEFDGQPIRIIVAEALAPLFPPTVYYMNARDIVGRMGTFRRAYNMSFASGKIMEVTQIRFEKAGLPPLDEWLDPAPEQHCCPICFAEDDATVPLPRCGHRFHEGCINQWKRTGNNTCHMCRQRFE